MLLVEVVLVLWVVPEGSDETGEVSCHRLSALRLEEGHERSREVAGPRTEAVWFQEGFELDQVRGERLAQELYHDDGMAKNTRVGNATWLF